jgi:hypothetical protein
VRRAEAVVALVVAFVIAVVGGVIVGPFAAARSGGPAPAYRLRTVTLADGRTAVARWNPCQPAITYRVNLTGVAAARRPALLAEIRSGVARLAAADGLTYSYTGTTGFVPRRGNLASAPAEIVVAVVDRSATDLAMTPKSLGFGGVLWSTWSGGRSGAGVAVVRGYVVLSPAGLARLRPGFGAGRSQGNVILHELGHATGLEHTTDAHQVMHATLTSSAPAGWAPGDRAGLRRLGKAAGCIAIPSSVTVTDL